MKKILQTKIIAPLGTALLVVASYIGVAYFAGEEDTDTVSDFRVGSAIGYCDLYFLSKEKPPYANSVELARLSNGNVLYTVRVTGEEECMNAPAANGYAGSTEAELRANSALQELFTEKESNISEIDSSGKITTKKITKSALPLEGSIHKWCCD